MCIRDRYQRRVRGLSNFSMAQQNPDDIEVQFEHTYQLKPHGVEKFDASKVKEVITEVFQKKFGEGFEYNADDAADMGTDVCTEIQDRVKELGFKRYKLITQVTLGEIKGQTMRIGSRCLWDVNTDNCASEVLQNNKYFCCAMVFGLYFE
eukprot:TRINITY_DN5061_c0_g1_i3.p1 TRINITY_DN5061_c0_g1~~TRINITY_DN5061_c0_g1_i3.p1  ORF type:complete len:150 (-),score=46.18 TRINITY_DN5061_c0_g1_i3:357-806(-)